MQKVVADPAEQNKIEIDDVVAIVKRRRYFLIIPTLVVLIAVIPVALLLPREYRSKAIILIEQPDIPPDLVSSTVTTLADQRIQVIEQRFKATSNLIAVMDKYRLYPNERDVRPINELVDEMREKINVDLISATVMDARSGRPRKATIAFSLTFDYNEPGLTQKVTSELVSWYLNENARERQKQAEQAAAFLSGETEALARTITELEGKVAKFKEKHAGSLPEEQTVNRAALQRAEDELRNLDLRAAAIADRRAAVEMELGYLSSFPPPLPEQGLQTFTPPVRLKMLQAQLTNLKARYTGNHPDVTKLTNEIAALEAAIRQGNKEASLAGTAGDATTRASSGDGQQNLREMQLKSSLQTIESEAKALAKRREAIQAEIADINDRLARTPMVEQEYRVLARAYENAHADYLSLRGKRLAAELGESLESEGKSERFEVIEPPSLPTDPERPNRALIIGGGGAMAIAIGIAMAILAELLDPTIRGQKYLLAKTGVKPLAFVPTIRTRADVVRLWVKRVAVVATLTVSLAGSLAYVHFKVKPLDVVMASWERRLEAEISKAFR